MPKVDVLLSGIVAVDATVDIPQHILDALSKDELWSYTKELVHNGEFEVEGQDIHELSFEGIK